MTDDEVKEIQRHNQTKATARFFFLNAKLSAAARLHIFHHSHTPCSTFSANKLECSGYVTVCEMEPITDYSSTKTKQPFIRQASIPDLKKLKLCLALLTLLNKLQGTVHT